MCLYFINLIAKVLFQSDTELLGLLGLRQLVLEQDLVVITDASDVKLTPLFVLLGSLFIFVVLCFFKF